MTAPPGPPLIPSFAEYSSLPLLPISRPSRDERRHTAASTNRRPRFSSFPQTIIPRGHPAPIRSDGPPLRRSKLSQAENINYRRHVPPSGVSWQAARRIVDGRGAAAAIAADLGPSPGAPATPPPRRVIPRCLHHNNDHRGRIGASSLSVIL